MIEKSGGDTCALEDTVSGVAAASAGVSAKRNLTAQERLELLFDPGADLGHRPHLQAESGSESWPVLTAVGPVAGLTVCAVVQDAHVAAQGLEAAHWRQIQLAMEFARDRNLPLVAMLDGSQTQLAGQLQAWSAIAQSAGSAARCPAPKLALITGENTGPGALLASLFDAVVMTRTGTALTLTDATIANRITNTCMQESELGGWQVHASQTGLADLVCDNEVMGIRSIRRLLQYSADSCGWTWPAGEPLLYCPGLDSLIPDEPTESYDVRELLREVSDTRSFLELGADLAGSIVVGFAPVDGRAVGLIAAQNKELAGALDIQACNKAARHVRLCAAMGIPVVTFVDVPGFVPGLEQEAGGLARAAAELIKAYAQASVPKVTVVVGKALGAAGITLGSRATQPAQIAAWRGANLGLMGAGGVRSLAERSGIDAEQNLATLDADYALSGGYIDAVLLPGETRQWLGKAVALACQSFEPRI